VPLTALDLLAPVVTPLFSAHRGTLDRLAVHHACARLRIPLQADPEAFSESTVDPLPGTIDAPNPKIMVDSGPSREVVGEQAPLTATLEKVEDGVEDFTETVGSGASLSLGGGHVGFYVFPFGVGKIRRVRLSHAC
jgi:hypothetical protein